MAESRKIRIAKLLLIISIVIAAYNLITTLYFANPFGAYTVFGRGRNDVPLSASAYGTHGSISIPEVGYVMPLDDLDDAETAQATIDKKDRAGFIRYYLQDWIADHNYNGFHLMGGAIPNETKAYISYPDGTVETYLCTDNFIGKNTGTAITTEAGTPINDPDRLGMFTCTFNCERIRVTLWKRIS